MVEKLILSIAAGKSIDLIEKYELHSHPNTKYYNYGNFEKVTFRKKYGVMNNIYSILEKIEFDPRKINEIELKTKFIDKIKLYVLERMSGMGFSKKENYIFYVLKKEVELKHEPRIEKNVERHLWIKEIEFSEKKPIVYFEKKEEKVKVDFTGYWTFFCNPKHWKIDDFLFDLEKGIQSEIDTWRITDWQEKHFRIGDYGIIRVGIDKRTKQELNGKEKLNPGIYAIVKIIDLPTENIKNENEEYWETNQIKEKRKKSVQIEFIKNLNRTPILFNIFKENININKDKYLVKGYQASSMPLLKITFDEIMKIIKMDMKEIEKKEFLDSYSKLINFEYSQLGESEKEGIVKFRLVQNKFKKKLKTFENKCKICGLNLEELLIASHIKPWKDSNIKERINFYNGFLLCPTHDKLFDRGFISFYNNGKIIISNKINENDYSKVNISNEIKIDILEGHFKYLNWHREKIFKK